MTIRYTTNGTTPTTTSPIYTKPISVTKNMTVKARAWRSGWMPSPLATATYNINVVAVPALSVSAGTYKTARTVIVTCATEGATIHYTTNGLDPTMDDPVVANGGEIVVDHSMTLKVKAFKENWGDSPTASAAYTIS